MSPEQIEAIALALGTPDIPDVPPGISSEEDIRHYAQLLYPYIQDGDLAYGKAAEMLGMCRLDLIDLYGKMGLPYFTQTIEEVLKDLETLRRLDNRA